MIKTSNWKAYGFEMAIKGMRNAYDSREKSDSVWERPADATFYDPIGPKDLELACRLIKAGTDHRKFLRMIHAQMDVLAPLYWWKEADQYKIGTTTNSSSTMHSIHKKEFSMDDFSCTYTRDLEDGYAGYYLKKTIETLNKLRASYLETKDMKFWYPMIELLPSSYNQLRTIDLDYETLLRMYMARRKHKLGEWQKFCLDIRGFKYMPEFIEACGGEKA